MENLLIEAGLGIVKLFIHPLFYWFIFFGIFISKRRIQDEKLQFGQELFPLGAEFSQTWTISIYGTILASLSTLVLHTTFAREILLFLSIVFLILTFAFGFRFLSAVYSIGLTYLFLKILQALHNPLFENGQITNQTFSTLALLLAIFLLVETMLYRKITNETSFPERVRSQRGRNVGLFHLQRASFIPFFVPVPPSFATSSVSLLPSIPMPDEAYSLVFVPFMVGFHYVTKANLPEVITYKLRRYHLLLTFLVFSLAAGSFYLPGLASIAILIAFLGKMYIHSHLRKEENSKGFYFIDLKDSLTLFAVQPKSAAEKLGFKVGDRINKINDRPVKSLQELIQVWEHSPPTSFEVIDRGGNCYRIMNERFHNDFPSFGLIFIDSLDKSSLKNKK